MIPYGRQTIEDDDVAAVAEAMRADFLTQGPLVGEFERALAARCQVAHAVAVANGTLALQAAYFAAGIGPGDEVVTSALTFAATATAALWQGASVRFADVDPETGNVTVETLAEAITPATRVLAPVDFAGHPVDLDPILELARQRGLIVVLDACHSLGATYRARPVGADADLTVFSFHPVKAITTGEGGAVLTNNASLYDRLTLFRHHGICRDANPADGRPGEWYYEVQQRGTNGRLTDVQSALGLSQLRKLDRLIAMRRRIAGRYERLLTALPQVRRPITYSHVEPAWHLYVIHVETDLRAAIFQHLRAAGIGVQVHYIPVYQHPYYRSLGFGSELCPEAERFYAGAISLPMFPTLSEEDQDRAVRALEHAVAAA